MPGCMGSLCRRVTEAHGRSLCLLEMCLPLCSRSSLALAHGKVSSALSQHGLGSAGSLLVSHQYPGPGGSGPWPCMGSTCVQGPKKNNLDPGSLEPAVRPGFEFIAGKPWAKHIISLKLVHW